VTRSGASDRSGRLEAASGEFVVLATDAGAVRAVERRDLSQKRHV
jgi:hypothetical protein